jgi:hypothetical protein
LLPEMKRSVFIIPVFAMVLAFSACYEKPAPDLPPVKEVPPAAIHKDSEWFVLRSGRFIEVDAGQIGNTPEFLPWTVQERIADIVDMGGRLVFGVNGYGLASFDSGFKYYYDPSLYNYRTFTGFYRMDSQWVAHVYFNSILNVIDIDQMKTGERNLLEVEGQASALKVRDISMPFQAGNKGWELVSLIPSESGDFFMEWKYISSKRSDFRYTRYESAHGTELPSNRSEFLRSYNFRDMNVMARNDPAGTLLRRLARDLARDCKGQFVHFILKRNGAGMPERYAVKGDDKGLDFDIVTLTIEEIDGEYFALRKDGRLYRLSKTGEMTVRQMPPLPEGMEYTLFRLKSGIYFCAFEEVNFFEVGAAGLVMVNPGAEQEAERLLSRR